MSLHDDFFLAGTFKQVNVILSKSSGMLENQTTEADLDICLELSGTNARRRVFGIKNS